MTIRFLNLVMVVNGALYRGEKSDEEMCLGRRKKR